MATATSDGSLWTVYAICGLFEQLYAFKVALMKMPAMGK